MAVSKGLKFKIGAFWVIFIQVISSSNGYIQITVPDQDEFVINSNTNFTLVCQGSKLISWIHQNVTEEKSSTIVSEISKDGNKYTSLLHIVNASYLDTGFYNCQSSDETEANRSVYLYVNDDEKLTIIKDADVINAVQGRKAVLPCRPTSPDVQVELFKETEKIDENEYYEYDPKYGFSLDIYHDFDVFYNCLFTKGNVSSEYEIYIHVIRPSEPVEEPIVIDRNNGHTIIGGTVNLTCEVTANGNFDHEWIIPNPEAKEEGRIFEKKERKTDTEYIIHLEVRNATSYDRGVYYCIIDDLNHKVKSHVDVAIYDVDEHFIKLHEKEDVYEIHVVDGENLSVMWVINVTAHPIPNLVWHNNRNEIIHEVDWFGRKYNSNFSENQAVLVIHNVTISDRGVYELKASTRYENETLKLFLNVSGKPTLKLTKQDFYVINQQGSANCSVSAFPKPTIHWTLQMCSEVSCSVQKIPSTEMEKSDYEMISTAVFTPYSSGFLTCYANNSLGSTNFTDNFEVTDVEHGFDVWSRDDNLEEIDDISIGVLDEPVTLYCGASKFYYSDQLSWYFIRDSDLYLIKSDDHYIIDTSETNYSYQSILKINIPTSEDSGIYRCRGEELPLGGAKFQEVHIKFKEPEAPIIISSNLNGDSFEINTPGRVEFFCSAVGTPSPKVIWLKDDVVISDFNQTRIRTENRNESLILSYTLLEDEGIYKCRAENRYGINENLTTLKFKNKPKTLIYVMIGIVICALIVFTLIYTIIREWRQKKKLLQELKSIGLNNFEKGALENLNPELGVDDQAELLPYDTKFEFPREKLKLGKQLGAGAFGMVVKAEAKGLIKGEDTTTVAVKMVKRNADASHIKSLVSELKIMVHLGNHLNVVNLLGACTKDAAKTREVLVIVEYCRFGNIHNFLIRHRQHFINQIDPKTQKLDFSIGSELLERTFSVSSSRSEASNYSNDLGGDNSTQTVSTNVSMSPNGDSEDFLVTSNNSVQPEWRSNYRGDYRGIVKTVTTKDLISWAFQVARGMDYLASRKVLHGDLAARNILLAENNIVKICDFGLAKSVYKNDNYQKKGDGLLPVKWMAIESIRDRIFSTQSDIWSFGIVLWELFSLARTPYPGMEANERLFLKLIEGYRMDAPEYASKEIYQIMLECWHPNPIYRPSFTKLSHEIGLMLEDSVKQHYIDLNDPYLKMNTNRLETQEDYLAMLSPPDFINLSSPNYINEPAVSDTKSPVDSESQGYLCMRRSDVFSPTPLNTSTFVFDTNRKPSESIRSDEGIEMEPMLGGNSESDCESHPNSPSFETNFSNPTYHMPPKIIGTGGDLKIIHSTNNYVNMPQNKSVVFKSTNGDVNNKDGEHNFSDKNEYVNNTSRDWEKIIV